MTAVAATSAVKASPRRSRWWVVHQWAGLQASLLLAFILATGTLATVATEIDWLIHPAMRVVPRDGPPASWGDIATSARVAAGNARVERISAPVASRFAVEVIASGGKEDQRFRIQIDPWTAKVQGITSWTNTQRILRELHRHLMLPLDWGLPVVAILSLPMILSAVTAFWVYKKWWRGFFRLPQSRPTRRGDARRFIGDLHRFAGLWTWWFVLLIGLTGLWYLVEWGGGEAPPMSRPATMPAPTQLEGAALDQLVAKALQTYPGLRISSIYFPDGKQGGVIIMGQAEALLVRDRANSVQLDAASRQPVQRLRGVDLSVHQRISEAADPLHFGNWGGLASKLLWFACGCVLTGLAVSGLVIYALRLHGRAGNAVRLRSIWRGMGLLAWPSAIVIAIALGAILSRLVL